MPSRRSALPHSPPSRLAGRVPFASSRPRHPRRAAGVMGSLWALLPLGQPGVGEASSRRTGPHQALIDASSTAVARQCVYICVYENAVAPHESLIINMLEQSCC